VNVGMTIVEAAEARGEERSMRIALMKTLRTRFGSLPFEIERAVEAAGMETLRARFEHALTAPTLADVGILPAESSR
jgi:hypothetical protein